MNGFDVAIKEIQSATAELKEANDYAEFLAEERAKFERQLQQTINTPSYHPRLVRDLINDKMAVYVDNRKVV
jgi:hypothetical protein